MAATVDFLVLRIGANAPLPVDHFGRICDTLAATVIEKRKALQLNSISELYPFICRYHIDALGLCVSSLFALRPNLYKTNSIPTVCPISFDPFYTVLGSGPLGHIVQKILLLFTMKQIGANSPGEC